MQISEHPSIRECVQEDENMMTALLEGVLNSDSETRAILALRGDDAHSFLNLLQIVSVHLMYSSHSLTGFFRSFRKANSIPTKWVGKLGVFSLNFRKLQKSYPLLF